MLRNSLIIFLLSLASILQAKDVVLVGKVFDITTKAQLVGASVSILSTPDSSVIFSTFASKIHVSNRDTLYTSDFAIKAERTLSSLVLRVSNEGYETLYIPVTCGKNDMIDLGKIYMKRSVIQLSEVTVIASKVKFYNKRDTIVYNADAFVLSEGSMLDALIRQLPGVELKQDGRIFVNGKYVENLMLNGRDFFKGNNKAMLENLGAYTVKNIKVYEQLNELDKMVGTPITGQKIQVMDVTLKRDYMDSWMGNAFAGLGTESRYAARSFVSRVTPRSHIALFGNTNNVNDNRKVGENVQDWTPSSIPTGLQRLQTGGLDYLYELPDNVWRVNGNMVLSHLHDNSIEAMAQTSYLQSQNTYDYQHTYTKTSNVSIATTHSIQMDGDRWKIHLTPELNFKKWNSNQQGTYAMFNEEQSDWSHEFIRSIYEGLPVYRLMVNRKLNEEQGHGKELKYSLTSEASYKLSNKFDFLTLEQSFQGSGSDISQQDNYILDYPLAEEKQEMVRKRTKNSPNNSFKMSTGLTYTKVFGQKVSANLGYKFSHNHQHIESKLYAERQVFESSLYPLPSMTYSDELALDNDNSYKQISRNITHTLSPAVSAKWGGLWLQASFPVTIDLENLDYQRGEQHIKKSRTNIILQQSRNTFVEYTIHDWTLFTTATYTTKAPDLLQMIDITDTSQPLVVLKGNDNLKSSKQLMLHTSASIRKPRKRFYGTVSVEAINTYDALARGYSYDSATGIKTYTTNNVDGNWSIKANNYINWQFGPKKIFSITHTFSQQWEQSADLMGDENSSYLNKVKRITSSEDLSLGMSKGSNRVSIVGHINYSTYTGNQKSFVSFHPVEFHYGANAVVKLHRHFDLSTDFMLYYRRGYQDEQLNSNNYVWNMRLTYSNTKGNLILSADGFDILHNLDNVFYTVNALARKEVYRNVLPHYVMLGLQWRFNTKNNGKH